MLHVMMSFLVIGYTSLHPSAIKVKNIFEPEQNVFKEKDHIVTDRSDLLAIATHALKYCESHCEYSSFYREMNSLLFPSKQEYKKKLAITLRFLIKNLSENSKIDQAFLNKHFISHKWNGDKAKHLPMMPAGTIRLTKYPIFIVSGSMKKTSEYQYALYSLPSDEQDVPLKEIDENKDKFLRFRYSKAEILDGALDTPHNRKHTSPLVWLSKAGLKEALMQGTIIVKISPHEYKIFNTTRLTRGNEYSFFKCVGTASDPHSLVSNIHHIPRVTFAGDISNIGLSQFIALKYFDYATKKNTVQLGVLCDTGGAFKNNLHQLDYFMGPFESHEEFRRASLNVPPYVQAYILVKK